MGRIRGLPSVQVTLALALLVLGFLIAAQIAAEGPRNRYSTEERSPLIETSLGLQAQQEALKAEIVRLRTHIGELEAQDPGAADSLRRLYADLEKARVAAGLIAVSGRGLAFKLEDGGLGGVDALVTVFTPSMVVPASTYSRIVAERSGSKPVVAAFVTARAVYGREA